MSVKKRMPKLRMQAINVAYDTFSDAEKKKQYDFELDHPQGFTSNAARGALINHNFTAKRDHRAKC